MRILVVEDDPLLADGLTRTLERSSHSVHCVRSGVAADNALLATAYELVVLDIGLPDIDGFEVLRRLRARQSPARVLILTARDAVEDRVHGLDLGADDYLTKPFSLVELEARVRALLRRGVWPTSAITLGGVSVDVEAKRLKVNGANVELTTREWTLLELFLSRQGRALAKEFIARQFTDDAPISATAVEVYVSRLRSKIEGSGVRIRTVRGFGYLLEPETA